MSVVCVCIKEERRIRKGGGSWELLWLWPRGGESPEQRQHRLDMSYVCMY